MRTNDAVRVTTLARQVEIERAARLKAQAELAGVRSANKRLKALVLLARAEAEKLKAEQKPADG
jgi:hypothetical protein